MKWDGGTQIFPSGLWNGIVVSLLCQENVMEFKCSYDIIVLCVCWAFKAKPHGCCIFSMILHEAPSMETTTPKGEWFPCWVAEWSIMEKMQQQMWFCFYPSPISINISSCAWRLKDTCGRDVIGYCQLRLTSRCRHPAPGQDLIPLQRLHVFAHSRDPHPAIKLWRQVPFTKSKTIFQIVMYCMRCFLKSNILKVELSMIKIGELLRKLWSLRSCFLILPPGALTPQGIEGATKRDVSKHWYAIQWCASRGWFIAHENWTSWYITR